MLPDAQLAYIIHFINVSGAKNDDPLHPAYVPTLFSFTSSQKKTRREASLYRHNTAEKLDQSKSRIQEKLDQSKSRIREEYSFEDAPCEQGVYRSEELNTDKHSIRCHWPDTSSWLP